MSTRGLRVVVLSPKAAWGLYQDYKIIEQMLRECNAGNHVRIDSVEHIDPFQFFEARKPAVADIQIHLEQPCRAAWAWGKQNIVVVNPEWYPKEAWNWVLAKKGGADMVIFKSEHARRLFPELDNSRARVVAWRAAPAIQSALSSLPKTPRRREFLYLVGASANKLAAAKALCSAWLPTYPPMLVVGNEEIVKRLRALKIAENITIRESFLTEPERICAQVDYGYHIVASESEGFGYTFAEAAAVGALPLWTNIPVYNELWDSVVSGIGRIETLAPTGNEFRDASYPMDIASLDKAVQSIMNLSAEDEQGVRGKLRHTATTRITEFRNNWKSLLKQQETKALKKTPLSLTSLSGEDLPYVAIITITKNRPQWFTNMAQNIIKSDYPPNKFVWVVADDGEAGGRIDGAIAKFQSVNPVYRVKYLSLTKSMPVGEKRNKACQEAPPDTTHFVMMDDDDYYPPESVGTRINWLTSLKVGCVYCATIPMYHCTKYISAMNVPPLRLSPAERVSEATLCFTREFWAARKFPGPVMIAEGEGFIADREDDTAEISPSGVIVSFLHDGNMTSRRVPADTEPNGCHYGFTDAFFTYLSKM